MLKINPIRTPCDRCAPSTPYLPRDVRYPFALSVQIRHFRVVTPKRRSGLLKPFARGPDGIAARRALAFEHPGFLLLRRGRRSVRVETGMGEGANIGENRHDGRKERFAGGGGAHRPDKTKAKGDPFKRL